ncbi:MAG: MFS transporter [Candidatus Bathyarchaeia archaeon]
MLHSLVAYARPVGVGILELGVITGVQLVAVALTKPLIGHLSDRYGRVKVIILGPLTGGLQLLMTPFTYPFAVRASISTLYGLGFAVASSSTPALVSDLARKESSGAAMGLLSTIMDLLNLRPHNHFFILVIAPGCQGVFCFLAPASCSSHQPSGRFSVDEGLENRRGREALDQAHCRSPIHALGLLRLVKV